jgi:hypothetical protein
MSLLLSLLRRKKTGGTKRRSRNCYGTFLNGYSARFPIGNHPRAAMAWDALFLRSISIFSIQSCCRLVAGRLVTARDAAPYITNAPRQKTMPINCRQA